jgi:hypothetical protein
MRGGDETRASGQPECPGSKPDRNSTLASLVRSSDAVILTLRPADEKGNRKKKFGSAPPPAHCQTQATRWLNHAIQPRQKVQLTTSASPFKVGAENVNAPELLPV